jgi:glycosyltransferase involved in cell wall biosynthesis
MITLIIPTMGRSTLTRTLESLKGLSNPNWKAIIVFDGIDPTITIDDERIICMKIEKIGFKNCAGEVRNQGMKFVDTEWIGFVDDDDILLPNYIDALLSELPKNPDVVIFRMAEHNLLSKKFSIITKKQEVITKPSFESKNFRPFEVGISFCMKSCLKDTFKFEPSHMEDYFLLDRLRKAGKNIVLSKAITYVVRPD